MEREKGRERIIILCEYERESCPKVVKKWLSKYHFSKYKCMHHQAQFFLLVMMTNTTVVPSLLSNNIDSYFVIDSTVSSLLKKKNCI
jgi:hypothetical protein